MADGERRDVDSVVPKGAVDFVQIELRLAAADLRIVPDVAECAANRLGGRRIRECVDRFTLPKIEGTDVVQAHQMIGMRMREQDKVEPGNRIAQELRTQIGSGVDEKIFSIRFDLHRLPQTLIARIA